MIEVSVFWRPAAPLESRRDWRWLQRCLGPDVFGDEVRVLPQAIARSLDLEHDGMVQKPIEQRGGDHGIAEDLAPFGKAAIGGEDHGAFFVASIDELEEEIAAARYYRQIADLVDDQQREAAEEADSFS